MSKQLVIVLCPHEDPECPEVHTDDALDMDKQVIITDDFGQKINMSKSQFRFLLEQAKDGELNV